MATKNKSNTTPESSPTEFQLPEGFVVSGGDLSGYWDSLTPIYVKPIEVKIFDGKSDPLKPSTLIVCELLQDADNLVDSKGEPVQASKGDLVGVWGRAGLIELKKYAGVPCYIAPNGEKDMGRGRQPMRLFKVAVPRNARRSTLPVADDYRKMSRKAACAWLPPVASSADTLDESEIDF